MYDPRSAEEWRNAVAKAVGDCVDEFFDCPIELTLLFYFPRPKSHYGTGKNSELLKDAAPKYHTQKPDLDNMCKAVMDSLNMVLYRDDSQVIQVNAQKLWAPRRGLEGLLLVAGEPQEALRDQVLLHRQCASQS